MLLRLVSFDAPHVLYLFLLLASILVYIYIKFYSNKKIYFPSFFLLSSKDETLKEGKKINFPKRFFYELLILLIFTLLLAKITPISKNNNYLFFLDNSFSTKVKISKFKTSFNNIQESALKNLALLPNISKIRIKTTDGFDSQKFLNKIEAKKAIQILEPSYSSDMLNKISFNSKEYKNTFVFSDRDLISKSDNIKVVSSPLSSNICNFSISNLSINEDILNVSLNSYCKREGKINLTLRCKDKKEPTKYINIMPKESIVESIKIPKGIVNKNTYSLCKIAFSAKGDSLKEDNEAFFIYNNKLNDVYLVNNKNFNTNDFLNLPFNIKSISYDDIKTLKKDNILIFNDYSLTSLPKNPSIIMKPKKDSLFYLNYYNKSLPITSFKTGSPLISYINPMNLIVNDFVTLKSSSEFFLEDIIKVGSNSIFSLFTYNDKKYIISGFSYLPLKDTTLEKKILFLNSIKYLNTSFLENNFKLLPFSYFNADLQKLSHVGTTGFLKINGSHEAFNFFDVFESDILNNDKVTLKIENFDKALKNQIGVNTYFKDLLILLIILIFAQIIYFLLKNN